MRKFLTLFTMLMLCGAWAFSQGRTISGRVTDASSGNGIHGVSVMAGTTGAQTNENGHYSISVPTSAKTLLFSSVGFATQQITLGNSNEVNVTLSPLQSNLQEVVVVGYGTQKRGDLTASISTVKGDALNKVAVPSIDKFLEGQVTGLQASTPSGILGQTARIRIRGSNSISNSSDPLIVVDGVPYLSGNQGSATPYNPLSDINPNDIENIEVLKDGSATAIYGSRAANGVILITTKRGKGGKAKISYNDWFASAKPSKKFKLLDANDFVTITNEKYKNIGNNNNYAVVDPSGINTDWQDEVLRTAPQQSHDLSISGATEQTNYFVSLGYANMKGMIVANDLTKYNFRAKLEQKALNNHLTLGTNVALSLTLITA